MEKDEMARRLNEAAHAALELYVQKVSEMFSSMSEMAKELGGTTHVHVSIALDEGKAIGMKYAFGFVTDEAELAKMMEEANSKQAQNRGVA